MDQTFWNELTLKKAVTMIQKKKVHPKELLQLSLQQIEEDDKRSDKLNAILTVHREWAEKEIDRLGEQIYQLPLAGLPILIKPVLHFAGLPANGGSKILENYISPYTGGAGERLLSAGGVPYALANMDEFAMGSTGENSAYGITRNPIKREYIPGGSSSGCAAAVGGKLAIAALGTDTGGSIRQPAACCGIVGLKPTYGSVSRYGLIAYGSSFDQIGPLTHTCEDAAILLDMIAGYDPRDATSLHLPMPTCADKLGEPITGKKIALPKQFYGEDVAPSILKAMERVIDFYKKQGNEFAEVSLGHTDYSIPIYYVLTCAEATTNLARFDGIRYGNRQGEDNQLIDTYLDTKNRGYGLEVKRRILTGNYVLCSGYYDAYYKKGMQLRTQIQAEYSEMLKNFDYMLTPTLPYETYKLEALIGSEDPSKIFRSDLFTVSANVTGLPALSVPSVDVDSNGMPISFQLLGKPLTEHEILNLGHFYQKDNGIL